METLIKFLLVFSFTFSLLFKLMNYLVFYRLYKASANMSNSNLDIIKQTKRRFSDCFTLGKPIENTESYIRRILLFSGKYNTATFLRKNISTCFLLIFLGILWIGYIKDFFTYENTILCIVISMVLIYIADKIFDTDAMENGFITCATDYLDNTIKCRLEKANSKRAVTNFHKSFNEIQEENTSSKANGYDLQSNKKETLYDKFASEMSATDDTDLITSIIDEFIL